MPLEANALTSLESVKAYLKLSTVQLSDEEIKLLEDLINACSTAIESYCGRKFKDQIFTDEYDGTGKNYLLLEQYPVNTITTIHIDGALLDSNEYKVKKKNGVLIRKNSVWPIGDINIEIEYTAGYSVIPADLEQACKEFVFSKYKTDLNNFSTTFTDGFVFRADAMPVQVKMLLQPYKKVM